MLFTVICHDKPGCLALRQQVREAHLAYVGQFAAGFALAGPLLDPAGQPCGSLLVLDCADRAAAEAFAAGDPYGQAGLFGSVEINGFRVVLRDGGFA